MAYAALGYVGVARADAPYPCINAGYGQPCDPAAAYASCQAQADSVASKNPGFNPTQCATEVLSNGNLRFTCTRDSGAGQRLSCVLGVPNEGFSNQHFAIAACSAGTWDDDVKSCLDCPGANPISGGHRWDGHGHDATLPCIDNCEYDGDVVCAGSWCVVNQILEPTGNSCSVGPTPIPISPGPDGVCAPIGNRGAQHCVSSGDPPRHCIVHASGLSQCWDGTEVGPRVDRTGTLGAGREVAPTEPTPHPAQEGAQSEGNSTARAGGTNFTIGEFSGNGNSADASDNGSAPGQGTAPGWGNTIGQGPGNNSGDGNDGDGLGPPGPGLPDGFYEGDGRTLDDVLSSFQNRVSNAPIVTALDGCFTVPQGGACPTYTLAATAYWDAMVFDYHCTEPLSSVLVMMGWLVLAVVAFFAFRIAVE